MAASGTDTAAAAPACREPHDYWGPKIAATARATAGRRRRSAREGWSVASVWECQLRKPAALDGASRVPGRLKPLPQPPDDPMGREGTPARRARNSAGAAPSRAWRPVPPKGERRHGAATARSRAGGVALPTTQRTGTVVAASRSSAIHLRRVGAAHRGERARVWPASNRAERERICSSSAAAGPRPQADGLRAERPFVHSAAQRPRAARPFHPTQTAERAPPSVADRKRSGRDQSCATMCAPSSSDHAPRDAEMVHETHNGRAPSPAVGGRIVRLALPPGPRASMAMRGSARRGRRRSRSGPTGSPRHEV